MITNELPVVKITDDIVVTVNNRKSTILNIQAMAIEVDKKGKRRRGQHITSGKVYAEGTGYAGRTGKCRKKLKALDLPNAGVQCGISGNYGSGLRYIWGRSHSLKMKLKHTMIYLMIGI